MTIQNAINATLYSYQLPNRAYGVPLRQCISAGPGAFITATSLLTCTISATSVNPIICAFAAGFDTLGMPIDYIGSFSSSQNFTGLTTNTTHYFYLERNTTTGLLTCSKIIIAPVYSPTAPSSPVTGQHWFKTLAIIDTSGQQGYKMYEWSGSAWVARQRVFIAELTTNGTAVTTFTDYALNRKYLSAWTTTAVNTTLNFAHKLGMTPAEAEAKILFYGRQNSSDLLHTVVPPYFYNSGGYGVLSYGSGGRLNLPFITGDAGIFFSNATSTWLTSADLLFSMNPGW